VSDQTVQLTLADDVEGDHRTWREWFVSLALDPDRDDARSVPEAQDWLEEAA
jgi:hypothetical protein